MLKYMGMLIAAGLVVSAADQAQAGGNCCCQPVASCCAPAAPMQAAAPVADPNMATAQATQPVRRYSYQPMQYSQPAYYYPAYGSPRTLERYLLPKTDPRRFST